MKIYRAKAPLRISFCGGGTDVSPYPEDKGGVVLSTTVDKFAYASLRPRADDRLRIRSLDYDIVANYHRSKLDYNGELDLVKAVARHFQMPTGADLFIHADAPPGTGDEPLTVAQLIKDAQAIIVTTPQEVALADVRKSINFCKTVKMEVCGVIENMSGYTCPHCGKANDIFGTGGGEKTALAMGLPFLGRIPFDPNMVKCADAGISYQAQHAGSVAADAFSSIAGLVGERTENK